MRSEWSADDETFFESTRSGARPFGKSSFGRTEARFRRHRKTSCVGKHRYKDNQEASRVRQTIKAVRDDVLRTYQCELCQGWHLTSKVDVVDRRTRFMAEPAESLSFLS